MKKNLLITLTALTIGFLSSCGYFQNGYDYGNTTKEFMASLMHKDYTKCISLMQLGNKTSDKLYMDTVIRLGLVDFHNTIASKVGEDLDYSFLRTEQHSTLVSAPIPNTTTVLLEFSNDKNIGVIEALFDNKTGKIMSIKPDLVKPGKIIQPLPNRTHFWIFGIFTLCVFAFNIYVLRRVYSSDMATKWQKYLAIILLNVPAVCYSPVQGLFFKFFASQFFLGINFVKLGYMGSTWIFGIPLGGLYLYLQLRKADKQKRLESKLSKKEKRRLQEQRAREEMLKAKES